MRQRLKIPYHAGIISCLLIITILSPHSTFAQDTQDLPNSMPQKNVRMGKELTQLEKYTETLLTGLSVPQAQYLYNIRQDFGVIHSARVVLRDVENAVTKCAENNPGIKNEIEARFTTWKDAIIPQLAVSDVALTDAVRRQTFRPTIRVNMLLDQLKAAFEERDQQINKVPVTSLEACEKLQASMDGTQENIIDLITQTTTRLNALDANIKIEEK